MKKSTEIFLSYCWADDLAANEIYNYLKNIDTLVIHKDKIDIGTWGSIKEYMQSISYMDFTILLISDNYLKSPNCMFEVLEVLRDRNFCDKIFPAVIDTNIYSPVSIANYVKYWQKQYEDLHSSLQDISLQNIGKLGDSLKITQDIASNVAAFLAIVADMNNPVIKDVNIAIENKLKDRELIENNIKNEESTKRPTNDLFSSLNIPKVNSNKIPTDLEKNQFMKTSFEQINSLISQVCGQVQSENSNIQISIEQIDTRNITYEIYLNGNMTGALKISLGSFFGGKENNIGITTGRFSISGNNSFNGIISNKYENGKLSLYSVMSMTMNQRPMTVEETVKDIWSNYILPYLER